MKGVEKRDTRFLFSEIRSAPRPHLKANSTRATLLFRNNGNVKLTATGNWHKCRPRLALFIHGKTFSSACVFSSLPLPFLSSSSFVRTTHSSFSYCSSLPSFLPPLPPWQPPFTCAESSLAFSLSPLSSRVRSFVRSCFSPAWILFVFCLPLFFSLHSSFVSPRPSRSVSSVPCVPLPPLFRYLSLSLNRPPTHHAVSFLLSPLFSFSFFSFLLFFCLCTLVRAREFDALCAQTALSPASRYYRRCARSWTPFHLPGGQSVSLTQRR